MKIWSVFSLVIVFHIVVIGLLLIQPGCQSQSASGPSPAQTMPRSSSSLPTRPTPQSTQMDPSFNSGLPTEASSTRPGLSAPTRPTGNTRPVADTSTLTPVLDPVQDELSLPSIESEYTVQRGDNLTTIARSQGVPLGDLLSANGLTRNSTIYVGQKLVIPASTSTAQPSSTSSTPAVSSGKQVVVGRGDSLGKIASRAGTTVSILKSLNGLTSDTIYVGQKLLLPDSAGAPAQATAAPSTRTTANTGGQNTYTVQPGDTPSGIARKFGISASQLMAANGITDPTKMNVGKVLSIPGGGSASPSQLPAQTVQGNSQPTQRRTQSVTTQPEPIISEPTADDPMSILEALEDEDIPFAEVEVIGEGNEPGN